MKTSLLCILLLLFSQPLQSACRCSCEPTDLRLCANNYDLDFPCQGECPFDPGIPPMRTACPPTPVFNYITKEMELVVLCSPR
jgi:hypothetical protein